MARPTEDTRVYQGRKHFNGSKWITMPAGIFWHKAKREYHDENGKPHDWNPNFPMENNPERKGE